MADFSNLAKYAVTEATEREYSFAEVDGAPSIFFAPAHDSNPAFLNERLRLSILRADERTAEVNAAKPGKVTPEKLAADIEEDREFDRQLLARTCARRWGTPPTDVEGNQPEFSAENCYAFLKALPIHMLDPLRNWAANVRNFVERPSLDTGAANKLGNA